MTDRIVLSNMSFEGRHGWHEDERLEPQPFEVDVELRLDLLPAAETDDLSRTADYGAVYDVAREVVESRTYRLLEALAYALADALLERFPPVDEVGVRIRKPRVAFTRSLESAAVEIW